MTEEKLQAYPAHLSISAGNTRPIVRLIDTDRGGAIYMKEFVTDLLTMKDPARNLDVRSLAYDGGVGSWFSWRDEYICV